MVQASRTRTASTHGRMSPPVSPVSEVAVCATVNFEMSPIRPVSVMNEPVDHRCGGDLVAEDLAQALNGLLLVTIKLARS